MNIGVNRLDVGNLSDMAQAMFKKLDTDKSGGITKEELSVEMQSKKAKNNDAGPSVDDIFNKADTNGDGVIDTEENSAWLSKMPERPPNGLGAPDSVSLSQMSQDLFKQMDADNSGGISKEELTLALEKHEDQEKSQGLDASQLFGKIDTNGDGVIDVEENAIAFSKMATERKGDGFNSAGTQTPSINILG